MKNKNYHIITFGCQMNQSDSERIASVLENSGFKKTSLEKANYIFLNLCAVRQKAVDRVWGKIQNIKKQSRVLGIKIKIILTGCILSEDKKKLEKKVDFILDINDLTKWPQIIKTLKSSSAKVTADRHQNIKTNLKDYLSVVPKYNSKFEAFVPIMTGCNNFCSYCAVPYTRGREKSRPVKDILNEVNKLIVQGCKFITLLGQNVNSYCSRIESRIKSNDSRIFEKQNLKKTNQVDFAELLKKINKIPGNYWLSFITSHPKDLSDELIQCFKTCKHLIPYLHLPIQSGSNKILKLMNRKYTVENYLKLIKKIKKINPDINLSTDVIVGFPGETKKDFNETAKIIKKVKFDMAYIARYSPRPDTAAVKLKDNISLDEKKDREKILNNILKITALEKNKKLINKNIEVLVENKKNNYYFGKTRNFKNVRIIRENKKLRKEEIEEKKMIGEFVKVKITKANEWSLEGELVI